MEGKSETKRREKANKTVSMIQIVNKDLFLFKDLIFKRGKKL